MAKTVIVGGGTIGLLSAYQLRKRGRDVVVIDKGNPGEGASLGNAGWVTPSLSGPVPAPGLVGQSIRWMLSADSPLYISPKAAPSMLRWLFTFWRHCNERAYRAGLTAMADLNRRTTADFDALKSEGLDFEMHSKGLLFVCLEEKTIESLLADFHQLAEYDLGVPIRYTRDESLDLEPILKPTIAGSVLMPNERHVRPESLNAAVVNWLKNNGVEIRSRTSVTGLRLGNRRVQAVETSEGSIAAEQVLIATGAQAGYFCRLAGLRLPMQAGKGYSITIQQPEVEVGRPMYMDERRVAVSPFEDTLRVAGTMELSGINLDLDPRRLKAIRSGANLYMKDWEKGERITEWVGMRPMLPDGLPAIGRIPTCENLFIAAGHAMLGITLGPTTAVAVAELMNGEQTEFDLRPYDPSRFS